MKKTIITLITIISIVKLNAQAFEINKSYVSLGYGFGNFTQSFVKAAVSNTDTKFSSLGPLFAKYEYAISENVGIGLNTSYMNANASATSTYTDVNSNIVSYKQNVKFSTWSALGRLNFHFGKQEKVDPYFGFGAGYRSAEWTYTSSDPNAPKNEKLKNISHFGFETTLGCRFLVANNFGFYTEVGLAKALFQIGLTGKF
jgi:outer membrane protein W